MEILLQRKDLPDLCPRRVWNKELTSVIAKEPNDCLRAGLYLLNDDIDNAHETAQEMDNDTANYWHAIVHRRERDFWNSKYWISRITHPVMNQIWSENNNAREARSNAKNFVDKVEKAASQANEPLMEKQKEEMMALLEYSRRLK